MTSFRNIFLLLILGLLVVPLSLRADSLSFSITPTLFEMAAQPGQAWQTTIKVINNNPFPLTVYANPVNFEPQGEFGRGNFIPIFEQSTNGATLAEWMTVSKEPIIIPKESSLSVPLQLNVPTDAAPGGHYAAVMIGTKPPDTSKQLQVRTSQIITSLFFVTVAGDVIEKGEVRTFRADRQFTSKPEMSFEVRFENKGNVHLQPQGEIVITNMWGKERGRIPINRETHFGNVLPNSVRKFEFSWKGEQSFTDIGRYKAQLTLGYGSTEKKFVTRSAIFWLIPVKPVAVTLVTFIFLVWFVTRSVRAYVRYMLRLSGIDPDVQGTTNGGGRYIPRPGDVKIERNVTMRTPFLIGISDLRSRFTGVTAVGEWFASLYAFVKSYKIFFASLLVFVILVTFVWYYFANVTSSMRDYEVTITNPDSPITLSSEEIIHNKGTIQPEINEPQTPTSTVQTFKLTLVNSSDTPGMAGALSDELEKIGYTIDSLQSDFEASKSKSVVVYSSDLQDTALTLSKQLNGALLSAYDATNDTDKSQITIYIGNDYIPSDN